MSSILLEARLTCALGMGDNHENNVISPNSVVCVCVEKGVILVFAVYIYNCVHSLIYWFLVFECGMITNFIAVNFEKSPSFKALLHRIYVCT